MSDIERVLLKKKRNCIIAAIASITSSIIFLFITLYVAASFLSNIIFVSVAIILLVLGYRYLVFSRKIEFDSVRILDNYLSFPYPINPITDKRIMPLEDIVEIIIYRGRKRVMIRGKEANVMIEMELMSDETINKLAERGINVREG